MVTFSGCVFDGAGGKEQPLPKQLIRAIEDKEYNRAYALLRRMRREGVALEEGKRAEALADALTCTLKLFKTLYEQVFADVPDEGVWLTTSFERVCGSVSLHGCVRGTLLTLALRSIGRNTRNISSKKATMSTVFFRPHRGSARRKLSGRWASTNTRL